MMAVVLAKAGSSCAGYTQHEDARAHHEDAHSDHGSIVVIFIIVICQETNQGGPNESP